MASSIVAIGHGNSTLSVSLTGVPVEDIEDVREVEKRLSDLMDTRAVDVVIVDEAYRDQFSEWFSMRLAKHGGRPLIIFCPAFEEEDPNTDAYINAIVKPAVGFEIRLD